MATTHTESMEMLHSSGDRLTTWQVIKRNIGDFLLLLSCGLGGIQEELDFDDEFRRRVRVELQVQQGSAALAQQGANGQDDTMDDLDQCLADVVKCNEYSLGTFKHVLLANKDTDMDPDEWDDYLRDKLHMDPETYALTGRRAKLIPKFAAHVALHIRSLLGKMEVSEANTLLVERKYNELCRKRGVRIGDAERHKQFVLNAVFTEELLERCGTARQRAPAWLRWCRDSKSTSSKRAVC